MSMRRMPLSKGDIIEMANVALTHSKHKVSNHWFYNWKKRYVNYLRYGIVNYSDPHRSSSDLEERCFLFLRSIHAFYSELHMNPKFIINADEIRFHTLQNGSHTSLITDRK